MYLFDLEDFFTGSKFSVHFNPSGFYNGKNSWLSDDSSIKIIWDTTLNAWKLSGDTLGDTQVINTNPTYPPINGNWSVLGQSYTVTSNQGVCAPVDALSATVNYNNPGCICDGSINVTATGGVPPYQYSYDNGVTYVATPIKGGLCGGNYQVKIKDSDNTIVTKTVAMNTVVPKTTYSVSLNTTNTVLTSVGTYEYTFAVVVSPPLPAGVQLNFDLVFLGKFMRTPTITSATSTFTPQVIKNGSTQLNFTDNTTETTGTFNGSGCQGNTAYNTNYSFTYAGLSMVSTDVYSIKVVTTEQLTCGRTNALNASISETELGPLGYGKTASATYNCCKGMFTITPNTSYMSNVTLTGCNCCTINPTYTKSLYE